MVGKEMGSTRKINAWSDFHALLRQLPTATVDNCQLIADCGLTIDNNGSPIADNELSIADNELALVNHYPLSPTIG